MVVELADAVLDDRLAAGNAELFGFGAHLGGQAVAVPAEAALDAVAAHGLVAGDGVLRFVSCSFFLLRCPRID